MCPVLYMSYCSLVPWLTALFCSALRSIHYNARVIITVLTIATYVWFNYLMIDEEVTMFWDYWLVRLGLRQQRRYFQGE